MPALLREAAQLFVDERRRLGYRELGLHLRTLDLLLRVVKERLQREPSAIDVTRDDLTRLLDILSERGLSKGSVGHAASSLRVFFRWLARRGALLLNPAEDLVVGKSPRRIGYVPSRSEVEKLLAVAEPEAALKRLGTALGDDEKERVLCQSIRDLAILELLYGSGLRLSEVVKLNVIDVDLAERTAFLKSAKGGKDRVVPLTRRAVESLCRYIEDARPRLLSGLVKHDGVKGTEVLFLSASGTRLYPDWRRRFFVPLVKAAGLPRVLTPHRLRHACAVHLLEDGADLAHIARLLGHQRIETTAIYLSLTTSRVAEALERAHPRERPE